MSGEPVTDYAAFAEAWAEVGPLVEARLRGQGTAREDAADITQEVAVRALARLAGGAGFDSRRGLLGWGHHVARNLAVDAWRKARTGEAVEVAAVDRGYDEVEWRLLLTATVDALETLPPAQQTAVLALLAGSFPEDKREQVRDSTRRTRARARLRAVVGRFPALWPGLRRWTARLLPLPALTAPMWLTPSAPAPSISVTTAALPTYTVAASARTEAPKVPLPSIKSAGSSRPVSVAPGITTTRDIGSGHSPVIVVEHPAGTLDAGTKPDEDRHFVCVEVGPASVCVDKLRR